MRVRSLLSRGSVPFIDRDTGRQAAAREDRHRSRLCQCALGLCAAGFASGVVARLVGILVFGIADLILRSFVWGTVLRCASRFRGIG